MPGMMALRAEYGESKPLSGSRNRGSTATAIQTAVLNRNKRMVVLGAECALAPAYLSPKSRVRPQRRQRHARVRDKGQFAGGAWDYLDKFHPVRRRPNLISTTGGGRYALHPAWCRAEAGGKDVMLSDRKKKSRLKASQKAEWAIPRLSSQNARPIKGVF